MLKQTTLMQKKKWQKEMYHNTLQHKIKNCKKNVQDNMKLDTKILKKLRSTIFLSYFMCWKLICMSLNLKMVQYCLKNDKEKNFNWYF